MQFNFIVFYILTVLILLKTYQSKFKIRTICWFKMLFEVLEEKILVQNFVVNLNLHIVVCFKCRRLAYAIFSLESQKSSG